MPSAEEVPDAIIDVVIDGSVCLQASAVGASPRNLCGHAVPKISGPLVGEAIFVRRISGLASGGAEGREGLRGHTGAVRQFPDAVISRQFGRASVSQSADRFLRQEDQQGLPQKRSPPAKSDRSRSHSGMISPTCYDFKPSVVPTITSPKSRDKFFTQV